MKTFKCNGIEYYAINCHNKLQAVLTFIKNNVGVTEFDIEAYEGEIPDNAKVYDYNHVIES